MKSFEISNFKFGRKGKTFIIAEISANHNHNFNVAVETIKAIKECGADAVKIQTYTADTITINCANDYFKIQHGTVWDGQTLYQLYQQAYTPWEWQPKLKQIAEDLGLIFFSTPFDKTAVDFLEKMNVPAYKIASFEITDLPLIEYTASNGKPIIISTGIATYDEITDAVNTCRKVGNDKIILLKCTSSYPASVEEANLKTISTLKKRFKVIAGLSDHTLGISVPIASVALGARVIEKHFILDKKMGGPDSSFSLEPAEFKQMVESIREVEIAIGKSTFVLNDKTKASRKFSRSLFAVKNISAGELFTAENVRSIRPGDGLPPKYLNEIFGKIAAKNIEFGTPLSWDLVESD